jgi:putative ABC transport system substrate-binding protein
MRRRAHLAALLGTLAAPRGVAAQPARRPRLAILSPATDDRDIAETGASVHYRGFFAELRQLGFVEGLTLVVERWNAKGETARYAALARAIVDRQPDVIYTPGRLAAQALVAATTRIPIVTAAGQPVLSGLAESLARPGRNVTGVATTFNTELWAKRLDLLREAVPATRTVAILTPRLFWETNAGGVRDIAPRLGVTLIGAVLEGSIQAEAVRRAFDSMVEQRVEALIAVDAPELAPYRELIVELSAARPWPLMGPYRNYTEAGGLMSYGIDEGELGRLLAGYVARVLRGEKPAEMPIRLMDKFQLVVNQRTAKALGLTLPPAILARADEVIE